MSVVTLGVVIDIVSFNGFVCGFENVVESHLNKD